MMHYYESELHFRHTWWAEGFQKRIFSAASLVMTVMHLSWFVKIKKRVIFVDQTSESNKHYFYYFFLTYILYAILQVLMQVLQSSISSPPQVATIVILHQQQFCICCIFVVLMFLLCCADQPQKPKSQHRQ